MKNGFKFQGMSHPRMDYKALKVDRKEKMKTNTSNKGKGNGYYENKHRENDASEVIERCVREGAMNDPMMN